MPPRKATAATSLRAVGMSAMRRHAAVPVAPAPLLAGAEAAFADCRLDAFVAAALGLGEPGGAHASAIAATPTIAANLRFTRATGARRQHSRSERRIPAVDLRVPGVPCVPRLHPVRLPRGRARSIS